jgi:hypothetical protein
MKSTLAFERYQEHKKGHVGWEQFFSFLVELKPKNDKHPSHTKSL